MTFGPGQIQNVINIHNGKTAPPAKSWGFWGDKTYDYCVVRDSSNHSLSLSCRSRRSPLRRARCR